MKDLPDIPVYLEHVDLEQSMARFYAIRVEPTLLGDWATVYRWGRIATAGQHKEDWFPTRGAALDAAGRSRAPSQHRIAEIDRRHKACPAPVSTR